ncbi:MAG: ABC transporter permease [Myxococcales bacterium]|nr:ABC transporter permease [Myxococcales bacterium]|tara:strand:+ start:108 stop:1448 length:1341 start_codon:yes stop_codon:yes gene_type:complete
MYARIAVRNLRQGGRRTWLLGFALSAVSGLLIFLLSLSNGVYSSMVSAATTLSAGHVNVSGFFKSSSGASGAPIVTKVDEVRQIVLDNTPNLKAAIERHRGWAKVVSDTGSMWAGLYGIDIENEPFLKQKLSVAPENEYVDGGRAKPIGRLADLSRPNTIALFAMQAKRLEVKVGDRLTVRTETLRGTSNTVDLTVVAVMQDLGMMSSWNVFMPTKNILDLYGLDPNSTGAMMLYLEDIDQAHATMEDLRVVLEKAGYSVMEHDPRPFFMKFETVTGQDWAGQKLDLTVWSDEVSFMTWVLKAIDGVSFLLICVLAGIIVLGIINALWIAVRERTREIGTLRAIGMQRKGILSMIMLEAAILGFLATALGCTMSVLLVSLLDASMIEIPVEAVQAILMSKHFRFVVSWSDVSITLIGFTFLCTLASIWPAVRAARMRPISAIQLTE